MYNRKSRNQKQLTSQAENQIREHKRVKNWQRRGGFGLNEIIGASAAVMIAALVIVPGMRTFSEDVVSKMILWWESMSISIFQIV